MARRRYRSRLARNESKRMMRQSMLLLLLTVFVIGVAVFYGIPALVKVAGLWGDIKLSNEPIEEADTIAPYAPQMSLPFTATSSATINLKGYAEAGSRVIMFNNGNKAGEVITGDSGEFEFNNLRLNSGNNELTAQAVDTTGNESPLSQSIGLRQDQNPPDLMITSPSLDGDRAESEEQSVVVVGETEAGASVTVNGRFARTGSDGAFSITINLSEGENEVSVLAVDEAGNQTEKKFKVTVY